MPSCNFYQATGKDVIDISNLLKEYKKKDLDGCNFPEVDNDKVNNFILILLKKGKVICVKNLDNDKLIGVCMFNKSEYWFSKQQVMLIQLIYIVKKYRNYQLMKQLMDMVKAVADKAIATKAMELISILDCGFIKGLSRKLIRRYNLEVNSKELSQVKNKNKTTNYKTRKK